MLKPTLNYLATQSPCKLGHLSYNENTFCMFSSKMVAVKLFSQY